MIQLGLTISDQNGHKPDGVCTWQFNFKYSPKKAEGKYDPSSIQLLANSGINFDRFLEEGIDWISFGVVMNQNIKWLCFHGCYDFCYFYKTMSNQMMPQTYQQYQWKIAQYFQNCVDIKLIIADIPSLDSTQGLNRLAQTFQVSRIGTAHQAGSDSLVTLDVYFKIINQMYSGLTLPYTFQKYNQKIYGFGIFEIQDDYSQVDHSSVLHSVSHLSSHHHTPTLTGQPGGNSGYSMYSQSLGAGANNQNSSTPSLSDHQSMSAINYTSMMPSHLSQHHQHHHHQGHHHHSQQQQHHTPHDYSTNPGHQPFDFSLNSTAFSLYGNGGSSQSIGHNGSLPNGNNGSNTYFQLQPNHFSMMGNNNTNTNGIQTKYAPNNSNNGQQQRLYHQPIPHQQQQISGNQKISLGSDGLEKKNPIGYVSSQAKYMYELSNATNSPAFQPIKRTQSASSQMLPSLNLPPSTSNNNVQQQQQQQQQQQLQQNF